MGPPLKVHQQTALARIWVGAFAPTLAPWLQAHLPLITCLNAAMIKRTPQAIQPTQSSCAQSQLPIWLLQDWISHSGPWDLIKEEVHQIARWANRGTGFVFVCLLLYLFCFISPPFCFQIELRQWSLWQWLAIVTRRKLTRTVGQVDSDQVLTPQGVLTLLNTLILFL